MTPDEVVAWLRRVGETRDANEAEEARAVAEARKLGLTWQAIAEAVGRSRQAIWAKYKLPTQGD